MTKQQPYTSSSGKLQVQPSGDDAGGDFAALDLTAPANESHDEKKGAKKKLRLGAALAAALLNKPQTHRTISF